MPRYQVKSGELDVVIGCELEGYVGRAGTKIAAKAFKMSPPKRLGLVTSIRPEFGTEAETVYCFTERVIAAEKVEGLPPVAWAGFSEHEDESIC